MKSLCIELNDLREKMKCVVLEAGGFENLHWNGEENHEDKQARKQQNSNLDSQKNRG